MDTVSKKLHFAGCTLDFARASLLRDGKEDVLRPKTFDVLRHLAENPGRVVNKEELIEKVWPGVVVTDDSLVQCIMEVRQGLGDADHEIVKTVPRRGYLFTAQVTQSAAPAIAPRLEASSRDSPVGYAKSGDIHIAYKVWGEGPVDLVFWPGFVTHIENLWTEPSMARYLQRMGQFARVITFDKRGTGMSDRVDKLPGVDARIDDVRAVMDAVGIERAAVMGPSEGGALAAYFAAIHPDRCQALVLYGAFAKFSSWIPTEEGLQQLFQYIDTRWGSGESLPMFAPSMAGNAAFQEWWGRFERLGASPAAAIALMRMNSQIDITDILPTIHVPTLIIHRTDDPTVNVEAGRTLAARIPNARLIEIPGGDHLPWVGDNSDEILRLVQEFLVGPKSAPALDRVLATVLVTEAIGSVAGARQAPDRTAKSLLDTHEGDLRQELARYRGRIVRSVGEGFLASFDGPARAIHGALAIRDTLARQGVTVSMGIHTGEVEFAGNDLRGVAVDIALRVVQRAGRGEVVVSRTVKDLVAGSGIEFDYIGTHMLEGVPDTWQLYRTST